MSSEDDASFLTILLETSPEFWGNLIEPTAALKIKAFVEQLMIFIRIYTLMNDSNQLAIFAIRPSGTSLLYASENCSQHVSQHHYAVNTDGDPTAEIYTRLVTMIKEDVDYITNDDTNATRELLFSSGISQALCFINKVVKAVEEGQRKQPQSRLLCISACPDVNPQYIAIMNAFFAAQRSGIIIDGCKLGATHSPFLQQAAHLTGGAYLQPQHLEALIQYLIMAYIPSGSARQLLKLPKSTAVDFRASCFCHKKRVDIGFVCSVCLSIYCERVPDCMTCQTSFVTTGTGAAT